MQSELPAATPALGPTQILWLGNHVHSPGPTEVRVAAIPNTANDVVVGRTYCRAGETFNAMTARDSRLDHGLRRRFHPRHQLANFSHDAGDIVPENVRQRNLDSGRPPRQPTHQMIPARRRVLESGLRWL